MITKVSKLRDENNNIVNGGYVYRGIEFYRDDKVAPGYFGRYYIEIPNKAPFPKNSSTQNGVKSVIDKYLDWKQK